MSSNASKKIKLEITWECVLSALKHETIVDEENLLLRFTTPVYYLSYSSKEQQDFAEHIGLTGWHEKIAEEIRLVSLLVTTNNHLSQSLIGT